ncbi:hypothetical protein NUU61_006878 [Penicillium alfredii]|uniref:N-acetyltransferase domain-containing protein n=1 Tax=Penicillium alfredii TaxID=1506179 RepID=A0A9W9K3R0_9EURO|nr:uncharacterized protein NUU61_006878 [Penicillium alfredii]KAJ5092008.1 hypothetical protein NUU61_006878 [Penicillium alfredii]
MSTTVPSQISPDGPTISNATIHDAPTIKSIVDASYSKYIERIGKPPAPMTVDYIQVIKSQPVLVLRNDTTILGCVILSTDSGCEPTNIENIFVDPAAQGQGYGRVLLGGVEKRARAKDRSALTLYTNAKMYENLGLYAKLGFKETESRTEDGYERVYFRKDLG